MKRQLNMPEISEDEFIAHIEDDDFLEVYGNPVIIRGKDGHHDCVLMSFKYYERMQNKLDRMEEQIAGIIDENTKCRPTGDHPLEEL